VPKRVLANYPHRKTLDHGSDTGRPEPFVEFTPSYNAAFCDDLDEVIVSPTCTAGEYLDASYV
jgi:hypothetical protein